MISEEINIKSAARIGRINVRERSRLRQGYESKRETASMAGEYNTVLKRKKHMKRTVILFVAVLGITMYSTAQQIKLNGVVTVRNSKRNIWRTQYVKNAEIENINPENAKTKDVTGTDGKFMLKEYEELNMSFELGSSAKIRILKNF